MSESTRDAMPDRFDRQLGLMDGLPDIVKTDPTIKQIVPPLGVGGSETFVVQTWRQREQGDTIFLQHYSADGAVRIVIPPAVAAILARQYEALSAKNRRKGARQAVETRRERGIEPGFLKTQRAKKGARK